MKERKFVSKYRNEFKKQRGSKEENDRKLLYLLSKIELNNLDVTMEDINQILTLWEHTFLRDNDGKLSLGEEIKLMYDELVEYSKSIEIEKQIIRL